MKLWRAGRCSSLSSTVKGLGPRMIGSEHGERLRDLGRFGKVYTTDPIPPRCTRPPPFADEPTYFAQGNGVRSRGSTWRTIPLPGAIVGVNSMTTPLR